MKIKVIPLMLLCFSSSSFASSEIADNFSHIGFGYKGTTFKSGALKPYLNHEYNNRESKTMGGGYLDVSAQVFDYVFVEGKADFLTRFSSELDSWQAGGGILGRLGGGQALCRVALLVTVRTVIIVRHIPSVEHTVRQCLESKSLIIG